MKSWRFTVLEPFGQFREIMGPRGEVLDEPDSWQGSEQEAQAELEIRAKRWSARGDCFIIEPLAEPL